MKLISVIGRVRVKQRGNNYYLHYSDPIIGQRIRRSVGPNERLAIARAGQINDRLERGLAGYPDANERRIDEMFSEFMESVKPNVRPRTYVRYAGIIERWQKYLDDHGIDMSSDVKPLHLERFKTLRQKEGAKSRTINKELFILQSAYRRILGSSPFKVKNLPVLDSKDIRVLSFEEVEKLFDAADEKSLPYWTGYYYTGTRKGELLALKWTDLDFKHEIIRVINQKTYNSPTNKEREIPLADKLKKFLLPRRKLSRPFERQKGHNTVRRWLIRDAEKAGIKDLSSIHALRHTFATHYLVKGGNIYDLMNILGHSSIETTIIYLHYVPSRAREDINKL